MQATIPKLALTYQTRPSSVTRTDPIASTFEPHTSHQAIRAYPLIHRVVGLTVGSFLTLFSSVA